MASLGCPSHKGFWDLQEGRQCNLTRSKDPIQRPEGLVRFQWNPDSRTGFVWPPLNLPFPRNSGPLSGINKWKWVWISRVGRNFISPVFHTRNQSTPVIRAPASCLAGVKTNNGHAIDCEASPDSPTPPKATLKWDRRLWDELLVLSE